MFDPLVLYGIPGGMFVAAVPIMGRGDLRPFGRGANLRMDPLRGHDADRFPPSQDD